MLPRPDEGRDGGDGARSHRDAASSDRVDLPLAFVAEQYLADLATRARPRGVVESRATLERVVRELGIEAVADLSRPAVLAWRQRRIAAGASNKTVNNALAVLLAALALCVQLEQIQVSPLHGLRALPTGPRHQRRRPRALSEWEIAKVLGAADELDREAATYRSPRIHQAILVRALIETGARWGELTLATWGDLDESGASLTFRAENTKTERERTVPICSDLLQALQVYRKACSEALGVFPGTSARIFLTPQGQNCSSGTSNFRRFLRLAYERAGLLQKGPDGRPRSPDGRALNVHTLRHTCCTRLARAGAPLPVAQAMLGHASPAMTAKVYSHFRADAAREYLDSLQCARGDGTKGPVSPRNAPMVPRVEADSYRQETRERQGGMDSPRLSGS